MTKEDVKAALDAKRELQELFDQLHSNTVQNMKAFTSAKTSLEFQAGEVCVCLFVFVFVCFCLFLFVFVCFCLFVCVA